MHDNVRWHGVEMEDHRDWRSATVLRSGGKMPSRMKDVEYQELQGRNRRCNPMPRNFSNRKR